MSGPDYKEGRGDYYLAEGKREARERAKAGFAEIEATLGLTWHERKALRATPEFGKEIERKVDALGAVLARKVMACDALLAEKERRETTLTFVAEIAESWHGDDAAKGRALKVIATTARAALSGDAATEEQT